MTDDTRRDIALGDLSVLDTPGAAAEPQLGTGAIDPTRSGMRPVSPPPSRPSWVAPRRPPLEVLVLGALVLLLAGAVVFLVVQQRKLSASLAGLEQSARESVASLETQVASTSTTMRSADSETQKSLNLIAADIGRIDGNIARLSRQLDQEAKARAGLAGELAGTATDLRKLSQASAQGDAQLEARLKTLADSLDQLAARQKTQGDNLARLERSGEAAQLRSEVAVLGASLREMQDEHERRLKSAEQAIGSTDAFRRQVNATIDRINQQVAELYQRR